MAQQRNPLINPMPSLARLAHRVTVTAKQPGRRFGPPPGRRTGATGPRPRVDRLTERAREENYRRQTGRLPMLQVPVSLNLTTAPGYALANGLTARQGRRAHRKGA